MELGRIWRKPLFVVGAAGALAVTGFGLSEVADNIGKVSQSQEAVLPCSDFGGTSGLDIATPGGNPATDPAKLEKLAEKNAESQQHYGAAPVGRGEIECVQLVDGKPTIYLNPAGMRLKRQYIKQHAKHPTG